MKFVPPQQEPFTFSAFPQRYENPFPFEPLNFSAFPQYANESKANPPQQESFSFSAFPQHVNTTHGFAFHPPQSVQQPQPQTQPELQPPPRQRLKKVKYESKKKKTAQVDPLNERKSADELSELIKQLSAMHMEKEKSVEINYKLNEEISQLKQKLQEQTFHIEKYITQEKLFQNSIQEKENLLNNVLKQQEVYKKELKGKDEIIQQLKGALQQTNQEKDRQLQEKDQIIKQLKEQQEKLINELNEKNKILEALTADESENKQKEEEDKIKIEENEPDGIKQEETDEKEESKNSDDDISFVNEEDDINFTKTDSEELKTSEDDISFVNEEDDINFDKTKSEEIKVEENFTHKNGNSSEQNKEESVKEEASFRNPFKPLKLKTKKRYASFSRRNFREEIDSYSMDIEENATLNKRKSKTNGFQFEPPSFELRSTIDSLKNIGNQFYEKGDYPNAIAKYSEAIDLCLKDLSYTQSKVFLFGNRSAAFFMIGRYQESLMDGLEAIRINETHVKTLLRVGRCYFHLKKYDTALHYFKKVLELEHEHEFAKMEVEKFNNLFAMLRNCEESLKKQKGKEVIQQLENLLEEFPGHRDIIILQSKALLMEKQYQNCIQTLSGVPVKESESKIENSEIYFLFGSAWYYSNELEKAKNYLSNSLALYPDNYSSKQLLDKISQLETKKLYGNNAYSSQKYEEAIRFYSEALLIDPDNTSFNTTLYANRAAAYIKVIKYKEGLRDCSQCLEYNPKYVKAYVRRAHIYHLMGNYEAEIADLEKALKYDSLNSEIKSDLKNAKQSLQSHKKDLYTILGVQRTATESEIKKAYKKKALDWHPDKHSITPEQRTEAEKMFQEINEAASILSDPVKRKKYDLTLKEPPFSTSSSSRFNNARNFFEDEEKDKFPEEFVRNNFYSYNPYNRWKNQYGTQTTFSSNYSRYSNRSNDFYNGKNTFNSKTQ